MPAGGAPWEERHIDDSKAQQGWNLHTNSLGDISAESLYRTSVKADRNRHSTARFSTVDGGDYKTGNEKASQAKVGRTSAGPGKVRSSTSGPGQDAAALRRKQRETRERDNDHLSDLLAKRLQSIEVRQAGLDEAAFAARLSQREAEMADEALAKALLEEEQSAEEERRRQTLAAEQADEEFVKALLAQEAGAREDGQRQVVEAEQADLDLARTLQEEEEQRRQGVGRLGAEADFELARLQQAEEDRPSGTMTITEFLHRQGALGAQEPLLLMAPGHGGATPAAGAASGVGALPGVAGGHEPLPGLPGPRPPSNAGSRPGSSGGRRTSRTGSRAMLPAVSTSAFQRAGSSIAASSSSSPSASPPSPGSPTSPGGARASRRR